MLVYTAIPKSKRRKPKGVVARKVVIRPSSATYVPPTAPYRRGSTTAIPSLVTNSPFVPARTSPMDPANLAREPEHIREAIIAKSRRVAPQFNKGAIQYITEEADLTTLGRKIK
jgi:hypothetical protein